MSWSRVRERPSSHDIPPLPRGRNSQQDEVIASEHPGSAAHDHPMKGTPMIDALREFTASFPEILQWLGVALVSAIPFVESYVGSAVGVIAGIHPAVAIAAAVAGNVISMLAFVFAAHGVRSKVTAGRPEKPESARRQKLRERFDKYGVAGVSLLGQTLLPSQITSAAMVSFGASRNAVILWQIISIILWGVLFGVLATLGVTLAR